MNENRKQMIDALIKRYGFEADATVDFAMFCEKYPTPAHDRIVKMLFNTLMNWGDKNDDFWRIFTEYRKDMPRKLFRVPRKCSG